MPCFLRPPVLPDGDTSTDYTPMSDVSSQEQNNFQGSPVMGWTSPSSAVDSAADVVKTDVQHVGSYSRKSYLEPVEFSSPAPPQLPPRADARLKDGKSQRKMPKSILLRQNVDEQTDKVDAKPYAVVPIGQLTTEPKTKSPTTSDNTVSSLTRKRAPHIYDEIDISEANATEMEVKQKEEPTPAQVTILESEESPYAEPNDYDDDDEVELPRHEVTPPPLPPRAPSMTPPCSPKLATNCSPEPYDDYVEPEVIESIKPNRSHSAPDQLIFVLNDINSKNCSTNYPVSPPKSPPKSPSKSPPKSPKATKEKKSKRGGTLYNLLRTFKKKSQAETASVTRILPEHIPSEEVTLYQNSVNKYNLDLPNVAEDSGSELQRRLSGKCRHGSRQGTLTRHRSLSPLDAYVDMHSENRPLSNSEYYEPMKLQELRQQYMSGEYDIPYSSPSPSPAPEEEKTDNSTGSTTDINTTDNIIDNTSTLRRSKSESSLAMEESNRTSTLGVTLLTQLSQSTECVINDEVSESCNMVSPAKSVDRVDSDAMTEVKKPTTPPRPQKPPIGPKPQIKPKPSLPPKPNNMLIMRPPISPRTKLPSQFSVPKLPPKPTVNRSESAIRKDTVTRMPKPRSESAIQNGIVTRTKADIRVPEDVGGNDRRMLKPLGKPPPPPPPKTNRSTSFVMVKKPPAAKGLHTVYSTTIPSSGVNKDGGFSPAKSPPALPDASEDRKKETGGEVVELKESDDDELEHIEYTVDSTTTTEQSLTTSCEADGTVGVQASPVKKRE